MRVIVIVMLKKNDRDEWESKKTKKKDRASQTQNPASHRDGNITTVRSV